jgi:hypothetical protein
MLLWQNRIFDMLVCAPMKTFGRTYDFIKDKTVSTKQEIKLTSFSNVINNAPHSSRKHTK